MMSLPQKTAQVITPMRPSTIIRATIEMMRRVLDGFFFSLPDLSLDLEILNSLFLDLSEALSSPVVPSKSKA